MSTRLAMAAVMALLGTASLHAADLKVGDDAPDFALAASDGKTYRLSDYKGKKAVVLAWFREGRRFASAATLLRLPFYVLWKLPMYLGLARRGAPRDWLRSGR